MEKKYISDFKTGEAVVSYFLIKSIECKTASNNKKFLDLNLCDKSGEINAKFWDCTEEDEKTYLCNLIIKIKGTVSEWQGKKQLKVEKIRLLKADEDLSMEDFIPSAPIKGEVMYEEINRYINKIENIDIKKIVISIVEENTDKLLYYPAAQRNHHSLRSGLLYHITTMLKVGESLSNIYVNINKDLLFAGIILHDIAKIDEMDANELGIATDYTTEGYLLGHIIQGIKKIDRTARQLGADEEISLLLQHMLLSHHYEPEFGSPKRPMLPEAELLHYIDMIDARMFDMEKALSNTDSKQFSEKLWTLHNRKLYKVR